MTYQIQSKTLWGNICTITLSTQTAGTVIRELTPAEEPFEMEMDDSTDIDTTLRPTTGTVRFVVKDDTDIESLKDILPTSLLGTKVEVTLREDGEQEAITKFVGYVEVTEYSQPYDSTPYEMELPVRDVISLLEDVCLEPNDDEHFGDSLTFSQYLVEAMTALDFTPNGVYIECVANQGRGNGGYGIMWQTAQREWFLEDTTTYANEKSTKSVEGCSFSDLMNKMLLANAMCMRLEDGYIHIRRHYGGSYYYFASWSWVKSAFAGNDEETVLEGQPYDLNLSGGFGGSLVNMSADNTVDYVTPARRVLVNQEIDDLSVFEFEKEWCGEWTLFAALRYNDTCSMLYQNEGTSQRGVSVQRRVATETGLGSYISDSYRVDMKYYNSDTDYVMGGVLVDLEEYNADSMHTQGNVSLPSTPSILACPMRYPCADDLSPDGTLPFIDAYCPVAIDASKGGCLCFNAKAKLIYPTTLTSGSTSVMIPEVGRGTDSGTYLLAAFQLIDEEGDVYTFCKEGSLLYNRWIKGQPPLNDLPMILFKSDGTLVGNYEKNVSVICYGRSQSLEYSYDKDEPAIILSQGGRYRYKEADGFIMPIQDTQMSGPCRLRMRLFMPCGLASVSSGSESRWHFEWLRSNNFFLNVSDIKVTWHPVTFDGDLPSPGDDSSGVLSATYINLPDEKTHVCSSKGNNGEDLSVDLDTWGDGDGIKWGNTVQPDLCDTSIWDTVSPQYTHAREIVNYDDARFVGKAFEQIYSDEKWYITLSTSWKASNEGGSKKYIQLL